MNETERVGRVRDVFDDWAERGRAEGMEAGHGFAARRAFERLGLREGSRYLDVGCGNGYTVRWAADVVGAGGRAMGIDVSPRMIDRARSLSDDRAEFRVGAFPLQGLEPGSFDAVFSMETFYYLPHLDRALAAVFDVLVPGGRFACIVDYYAENPASHGWPDDLGLELTLLSEEGWRAAFERAGLRVLDQGRLRPPAAPGAPTTWKQTEGSLFTLGGVES